MIGATVDWPGTKQDNVDLCRERLLCGREDLRHIVEKNIVCHDGLTYDYRFGEPEVMAEGILTFG